MNVSSSAYFRSLNIFFNDTSRWDTNCRSLRYIPTALTIKLREWDPSHARVWDTCSGGIDIFFVKLNTWNTNIHGHHYPYFTTEELLLKIWTFVRQEIARLWWESNPLSSSYMSSGVTVIYTHGGRLTLARACATRPTMRKYALILHGAIISRREQHNRSERYVKTETEKGTPDINLDKFELFLSLQARNVSEHQTHPLYDL